MLFNDLPFFLRRCNPFADFRYYSQLWPRRSIALPVLGSAGDMLQLTETSIT